jgi:cytoskeletal protein CcmA (bactofilin family)
MKLASTIFLLSALFLPLTTFAYETIAPFSVGRALVVASSSPGNVYLAGGSIVHTGAVAGDLVGLGGSIVNAGTVKKDMLLFGGSLRSQGAVAGDFRALGGSISSEAVVAGDFIAGGLSVNAPARIEGDVFVVGADVVLSGGAEGSVTVYGNTVLLSGTFADVTVMATTRLTLDTATQIQGTLSYTAPEEVVVPEGALVGHLAYTSASYLPDMGTSRVISGVSVVLFILVRILGALILAGLFAGLFPKIGEMIVERVHTERSRSHLLTTLLGFAALVATPVLIIVLALTFVGLGLAALLFLLYALLGMISVLYAGILLGGLFARRFRNRENICWHDGILGMLTLLLIMFVPLGVFLAFLLMMFTSGALLQMLFSFAFPKEEKKKKA